MNLGIVFTINGINPSEPIKNVEYWKNSIKSDTLANPACISRLPKYYTSTIAKFIIINARGVRK